MLCQAERTLLAFSALCVIAMGVGINPASRIWIFCLKRSVKGQAGGHQPPASGVVHCFRQGPSGSKSYAGNRSERRDLWLRCSARLIQGRDKKEPKFYWCRLCLLGAGMEHRGPLGRPPPQQSKAKLAARATAGYGRSAERSPGHRWSIVRPNANGTDTSV